MKTVTVSASRRYDILIERGVSFVQRLTQYLQL